jgi:hypothetical protein
MMRMDVLVGYVWHPGAAACSDDWRRPESATHARPSRYRKEYSNNLPEKRRPQKLGGAPFVLLPCYGSSCCIAFLCMWARLAVTLLPFSRLAAERAVEERFGVQRSNDRCSEPTGWCDGNEICTVRGTIQSRARNPSNGNSIGLMLMLVAFFLRPSL